MINILVAEDDKVLSNNIEEILRPIGNIQQAFDGLTALYEIESGVFDLVILDLMMPEMDGYQVLSEMRKNNVHLPVLILTAKTGLVDKIHGFEQGADDYLTKPFYREELVMRVKALLKRSLGLFDENHLIYKELVCDLDTKIVTFNQEVLSIQGKEFDLLVYFLQNQGIILTKEQIFDRIWGFESDTTLTVIEVYMSKLRKHLRATGIDKDIRTLRNVGYLFQGE